jgi:hypothetical protein
MYRKSQIFCALTTPTVYILHFSLKVHLSFAFQYSEWQRKNSYHCVKEIKDGKYKEVGSPTKRKKKHMVLSLAGKRDIHLVLLCSVSVNSQDMHSMNVKVLVDFSYD